MNRFQMPARAMTVDLAFNVLLVLFISSNLTVLYMSIIGYMLSHVFFFFQAEDGIRDGTVTGVQTCALPISAMPTPPVKPTRPSTTSSFRCVRLFTRPRLEERRVGKECRSRWSPHH